MVQKAEKKHYKNIIIGIILILFAFYYLLSILFPSNNLMLSSLIMDFINKIVGIGKYFIFFLLLIEGLRLILNINLTNYFYKLFGITALFLIILIFIHLRLIHIDYAYFLARDGAGGGLFGFYLASYLSNYFGLTGSYLFLIAIGLISMLFITDVSFLYSITFIFNKLYQVLGKLFNKFRVKTENIKKDSVCFVCKMPRYQ